MFVFVQSIEELPTGCSIVIIVSVRAIQNLLSISSSGTNINVWLEKDNDFDTSSKILLPTVLTTL